MFILSQDYVTWHRIKYGCQLTEILIYFQKLFRSIRRRYPPTAILVFHDHGMHHAMPRFVTVTFLENARVPVWRRAISVDKCLQEIHETSKDETMLLEVSSLSSEHAALLILYSVCGSFSSLCNHT